MLYKLLDRERLEKKKWKDAGWIASTLSEYNGIFLSFYFSLLALYNNSSTMTTQKKKIANLDKHLHKILKENV